MKAVILAGGKGTRLKPYTTAIPKPLVPVGERAILEILISRLRRCGVEEITVCLNHFAEIIKAFLGDGSRFGVPVRYSLEEEPLGTVGPIKLIPDLPEQFLVMNGDLLTDLDFRRLYDFHCGHGGILTVSTYRRQAKIDFGVLDLDPARTRVTGFREKPVYDLDVSMGVNVMSRRVLDHVPAGTPFGFDDLMLALLARGEEIRVLPYDGYWLDIGRPDDYERANEDIDALGDL